MAGELGTERVAGNSAARLPEGVEALLYAYCDALDRGELERWVEYFADDGRYKVITAENWERGFRLGLLDDNKPRMQDRILFIREFWNREPVHYRHLITPMFYHPQPDGSIQGTTHFVVFETKAGQSSGILAVGVYHDRLVPSGDGWRFHERIAVLDTALVTEMQYPL